ncbi:hypothetical protein ABT147_42145 [Streptomyces sp. NPDC001868]|uniref:hypothetical protein n=1 Tax=Streptomyces sp. NPDC001868 TaxID=3154401 RepID=UPI00332C21D5
MRDLETVQALGSGVASDGVLGCGCRVAPDPALMSAFVVAVEQLQFPAFEVGGPLQGNQGCGQAGSACAGPGVGRWHVC